MQSDQHITASGGKSFEVSVGQPDVEALFVALGAYNISRSKTTSSRLIRYGLAGLLLAMVFVYDRNWTGLAVFGILYALLMYFLVAVMQKGTRFGMADNEGQPQGWYRRSLLKAAGKYAARQAGDLGTQQIRFDDDALIRTDAQGRQHRFGRTDSRLIETHDYIFLVRREARGLVATILPKDRLPDYDLLRGQLTDIFGAGL